MKYQNTKTGVIFDSDCECTGPDWVILNPAPVAVEVEVEEKPKPKRNKKNGNSK